MSTTTNPTPGVSAEAQLTAELLGLSFALPSHLLGPVEHALMLVAETTESRVRASIAAGVSDLYVENIGTPERPRHFVSLDLVRSVVDGTS